MRISLEGKTGEEGEAGNVGEAGGEVPNRIFTNAVNEYGNSEGGERPWRLMPPVCPQDSAYP